MTSGKRHNAHMMIPLDLWQRAKNHAKERGMSMTELVCTALEDQIERYMLKKRVRRRNRTLKG